jgi:hypothetical protein
MPESVFTADNSIDQSELKESIGLAEELRKREHELIEIEIELLIFSESFRQKPDYQLLINIVHAISELEIICHYEAEILESFDFIKDDISKLAFLVIKRNKMSRISRLILDNFHVKIISEIRTRLKNQEAVQLAKKANEIASNSIKSLESVIEFYNRNASKSLKKY